MFEEIVATLEKLWRRIGGTRYTRRLEAENTALRAENRALLNSILGIAGLPPVCIAGGALEDSAPLATPDTSPSTEPSRPALRRKRTASRPVLSPGQSLAAPLRRRSWQQITRMLEFESARQKAAE